MSDWIKVWNKVSESLRFFWTKTSGTPWHVKVFVECALLNVSEDLMRRTLIWLAEHGLVTLRRGVMPYGEKHTIGNSEIWMTSSITAMIPITSASSHL
jgi:hypothetical protein